MNDNELEAARPVVTVVAAMIIDSFVITHSVIVAVLVTVSVLATALSLSWRAGGQPGGRQEYRGRLSR